MESEVAPTLQRAVARPRAPRHRWLIAAVALSTASTLVAGGAALATVLIHVPDAPAPQIRFVEVHRHHWVPPANRCQVPYLTRTVYRHAQPLHEPVDAATDARTRTCITTVHGEQTLERDAGADAILGTADDVCTTREGCASASRPSDASPARRP